MLQAIDIEDDKIKYRMQTQNMGEKAQEVYEGLPNPLEKENQGPLVNSKKKKKLRLMKQDECEYIATFAIR